MPARVEGWGGRLDTLIQARRHVPLQWGVSDCALFAADAVLAMTGVDPMADIRGRYADEESARSLTGVHGNWFAAALRRLGHTIPPAQAQRGDIALTLGPWSGGRPGFCVVLGSTHVVGQGLEGLVFLGRPKVRRAWAIGRAR